MGKLTEHLEELGSNEAEHTAVSLFARLYRLDRELERGSNRWLWTDLKAWRQELVEELSQLELGPGRLSELVVGTVTAIRHCGRVSSMMECLNSVLRPFLKVRKRATQGALALFAAWWNLHPRKTGKLRGSCPYTALTGQPVEDWLSVLGYMPQEVCRVKGGKVNARKRVQGHGDSQSSFEELAAVA